MFVGFTKTLKKMTGFRLGFGLRVNKKNWGYWLITMSIAGTFYLIFYLMWYMIIFCGYAFYFMCLAYYYMFKGIAFGCKKLYRFIKETVVN